MSKTKNHKNTWKKKKLVSLWNYTLKLYRVWQTFDPLRAIDPQQNVWRVVLFALVVLHPTDSEQRTGRHNSQLIFFKAKQSIDS